MPHLRPLSAKLVELLPQLLRAGVVHHLARAPLPDIKNENILSERQVGCASGSVECNTVDAVFT